MFFSLRLSWTSEGKQPSPLSVWNSFFFSFCLSVETSSSNSADIYRSPFWLAVGIDGQGFKVTQMEKNGTHFHPDKENHFASQSRSKATFPKLKLFFWGQLLNKTKQNKTKRGREVGGGGRKRITIGCHKVSCYGLPRPCPWKWGRVT